jgi:hypothetical protein
MAKRLRWPFSGSGIAASSCPRVSRCPDCERRYSLIEELVTLSRATGCRRDVTLLALIQDAAILPVGWSFRATRNVNLIIRSRSTEHSFTECPHLAHSFHYRDRTGMRGSGTIAAVKPVRGSSPRSSTGRFTWA